MGILCEWYFHWINPAAELRVRGAQSWSRRSALSYANAGLTSAVRSKRGRGTLELSLPPLRLTHSPRPLSLSLCVPLTHLVAHTPALSLTHTLTPCVPVRSYLTAPCWILPMRQADTDTGSAPKGFPVLLRFDLTFLDVFLFTRTRTQRWGETWLSGGGKRSVCC